MFRMRRAAPALALFLVAAALAGCSGRTAAPSNSSTPLQRGSAEPVVGDGEAWIVYQRYQNDHFSIRLVRPDGSGDHALVSVTGKPTHPDWSPDGSKIVFTVDDKELWTVDVNGDHLEQLPVQCDPDCYLLDDAAWAPDGASILYAHTTLKGDTPASSVEAVELETGRVSSLYRSSDPLTLVVNPRWSPDGASVVTDLFRYDSVDSNSPNGTALGVVDVKSAKLRMLVDWKVFATYPDVSPDGRMVVFSTYDLGDRDAGNGSDPYAASDLYTISIDGSRLRRLTHNATSKTLIRNDTASGPLSSQPRWSPDGRSIIYVQVDGSAWPGWTLAKIAADGTGMGSATGSTSFLGTHPELRPVD